VLRGGKVNEIMLFMICPGKFVIPEKYCTNKSTVIRYLRDTVSGNQDVE
jgi:hypothetical protein